MSILNLTEFGKMFWIRILDNNFIISFMARKKNLKKVEVVMASSSIIKVPGEENEEPFYMTVK